MDGWRKRPYNEIWERGCGQLRRPSERPHLRAGAPPAGAEGGYGVHSSPPVSQATRAYGETRIATRSSSSAILIRQLAACLEVGDATPLEGDRERGRLRLLAHCRAGYEAVRLDEADPDVVTEPLVQDRHDLAEDVVRLAAAVQHTLDCFQSAAVRAHASRSSPSKPRIRSR